MYNIIREIIDHSWVNQGAGDQQYVYTIAGTLIIVLAVTCIDLLYRTLFGIIRR